MRRAQTDFVAENFLNRFQGQYQKIDPKTFPALEEVLFNAGLKFNELIKRNLERRGAINTGALADVSTPIIYQNGDEYVMEIGYKLGSKQVKYYDYINKGVKGAGGKNARPNKSSGQYSFDNAYANRSMAASIYSWLNNARKSIRSIQKPISRLEKKRAKLSKMLTEADNKRKLAYAISTKVKRDGIGSTYYFDRALKEAFGQKFKEDVNKALGADFLIQIRSEYGNNNNG